MSSDYKIVLITDDRIANLTDSISYAVVKGAQQVTIAQFKATTQSASSIVFNVVVPSLETVIVRRDDPINNYSKNYRIRCSGSLPHQLRNP